MPADIDERVHAGERAEDYVRRMAAEKAGAVRQAAGARPVLGADTIVVVDGEVLGKPADDQEAVRTLTRLSGRDHEVMTAIALWWPDRGVPEVALERTNVWMREIGAEEIEAVVASGEPRDRAGAYAIQGYASRWITRIEGAPGTVVGLPVEAVDRLLRLRTPATYSVGGDET
jgi:septum formation protein